MKSFLFLCQVIRPKTTSVVRSGDSFQRHFCTGNVFSECFLEEGWPRPQSVLLKLFGKVCEATVMVSI